MNRVEKLLMLQKRAFDSSQWHSLRGALEGVDDDLFIWTPPKYDGFDFMNGSIRDIVYHVTGDKLVQVNQAFGDGSATWDEMERRIAESSRETMLNGLEAAHNQVLAALRQLKDEEFEKKVRTWGGKRMSAWDLFVMLIEHDLYHAGQIRYIRNIAG